MLCNVLIKKILTRNLLIKEALTRNLLIEKTLMKNLLIKKTLTKNSEIKADWSRETEEEIRKMHDKQLIMLDANDSSDSVICEKNTRK